MALLINETGYTDEDVEMLVTRCVVIQGLMDQEAAGLRESLGIRFVWANTEPSEVKLIQGFFPPRDSYTDVHTKLFVSGAHVRLPQHSSGIRNHVEAEQGSS